MDTQQDPLVPREAPPHVVEAIGLVFSEVMGTAIDNAEDFFDAGGSSVQAQEIITRLQQDFPPGPTVRQFYENASVEGLARVLTA